MRLPEQLAFRENWATARRGKMRAHNTSGRRHTDLRVKILATAAAAKGDDGEEEQNVV